VRFRFAKKQLESLYTDEKDAHKYPPEVVINFFEVMAIIAAAQDERDLYATKSLHYEKMKGDQSGERSVRLNRQWRLTFSHEQDTDGKYVLVIEISNHYKS